MWNSRTQMKWRSHPKHMDGGQLMVKGTWLLLCCPSPPTTISTTPSHYPPPNSTTPLAIQPTQETASTASHVAQVTSTDDKEVSFPNAPAPPCIRDLHLPISPQCKSPSSSSSSPQAGTLMRTSVTYVPRAQFCPFSSQNEEDLVGRIPSWGRL